MKSRAASRIRRTLRMDIPIHTQSIASTLRWLGHQDDGDDVSNKINLLNSTWYCPAFGQVNLFRILFCWRASNKVIVSIWSLLIPVRLIRKPAFETLPSRFGHAVFLKTNACTNWCQSTIYVNNWSFTGGDNFLGMKSTKSELVSISILKRPNREYVSYINAGENHKHSVSNFDQMTLAWEWV